MKLKISILLAFLLTPGLMPGQEAGLPPSDVGSGIFPVVKASPADIKNFPRLLEWETWLAASLRLMAADSLEESAEAADSAISRARVLDIHLSAFGRLLGQRAAGLKGKDQKALALRYTNLALAADPTSLGNILNDYKKQPSSLRLGLAVQQIQAALENFGVGLKAAGQMLLWFSLWLSAWSTVFLLAVFARHAVRLGHVLAENWPRYITFKQRIVFAGIIWGAAVVALGSISLPLAAGLLAAAASFYARAKERVLCLLCLLLMAAASIGLSLGSRILDVHSHSYLLLLDRANHSAHSRHLEWELRREMEQRPEDLKPLFALALLDGRSGRHQSAAGYYRSILESRPGNAPAWNNLGNIYFRLGDYDSAAACYQRALENDPGLAVAHYNLGQVYMHSLRFSEGRKELEKASALSPREIERRSTLAGGGVVLDALIPPQILWNNALAGWSLLEGLGRLDSLRLAGGPLWVPAAASLALLALYIVFLLLNRSTHSEEECQTCGRTICSLCGGQERKYCPTCAEKIFAAQSSDLQDKVARSLKPLKSRARLVRFVATNILVPGSSWALGGKFFACWLLGLLWGLVYATGRSGALGFYPMAAMVPLGLGPWFVLVLGLLWYLLTWLGLSRLKE